MKEILLIEDTEGDALLLERALRAAGVSNPICHVSTGADALLFLNAKEQALQKGDESELGIVFFDLKLPDKSGFDLLKLLQERKAFSNTLKVVVSQIEDLENIKRAYTLGGDSFITKPAGEQDLIELIRAFPENWCLVDLPVKKRRKNAQPSRAEPDPYNEAVHVWAKNREIIQTLRNNLETLRSQLSDKEETFAIIDTLTEELRNKIDPTRTQGRKKKPRTKPLL